MSEEQAPFIPIMPGEPTVFRRPSCATCGAWMERLPDSRSGMCRRHPPGLCSRTGEGRWPVTEDTDWCHEWLHPAEGRLHHAP